jgi:hypothetical protein
MNLRRDQHLFLFGPLARRGQVNPPFDSSHRRHFLKRVLEGATLLGGASAVLDLTSRVKLTPAPGELGAAVNRVVFTLHPQLAFNVAVVCRPGDCQRNGEPGRGAVVTIPAGDVQQV